MTDDTDELAAASAGEVLRNMAARDQAAVTAADLAAAGATMREALDTIGNVWAISLLTALRAGPARYTDLKRVIDGINDRMLSQVLQRCTRDGLVERCPTTTRRTMYALTPVGERVASAIGGLLITILECAPDVARARAASRLRDDSSRA